MHHTQRCFLASGCSTYCQYDSAPCEARPEPPASSVASAMAPDSRRRDDGDVSLSPRSGNDEAGAMPPQPFGPMGIAADLFVARRRRCSGIDSSSRLDLGSRAPSADGTGDSGRASGSKPRWARHLAALAMKAGEKCKLERISVRPPQLGDARALAEAELECFSDPWPPQFFMAEILADGRFNRLLVDSAGRMVAYLFCAWQYLDLHVLKVATLPEFRRAGLARQLMALAEDHAAEMGGESLTLEVRESNGVAIAMYEMLEYDRTGIGAGYYQNGESAVVMRKRMRN